MPIQHMTHPAISTAKGFCHPMVVKVGSSLDLTLIFGVEKLCPISRVDKKLIGNMKIENESDAGSWSRDPEW